MRFMGSDLKHFNHLFQDVILNRKKRKRCLFAIALFPREYKERFRGWPLHVSIGMT
jgi:hypothetical protein